MHKAGLPAPSLLLFKIFFSSVPCAKRGDDPIEAKEGRTLEYRNYHLPDDYPIFCLSGEQWTISQQPGSRLHFHSCTELGVCHSWHGILQIGERRHLFRQGDITLIPPYLPHTTWSDAGEKSRWSYLFFDSEYLFAQKQIQIQPHIPAAPEQPCCLFPAAQAAGLYALSCEILRELEQREQDYRSVALGLLQALIIKLSRLKPDPAPVEPAVGITPEAYPAGMHTILPALNELDRNYTEPITIARLADLCGISETHFRRCFRRIFGISPLAYLNRLRVQKACSLLRQPDARIISISERCGFQTLSSFNRHFKRLTGQSPTAWRHMQAHHRSPAKILEYTGWMLPEDPPQ